MAKKLKAGLLQQMMSVTLGRIQIALQRESPSLAEVLAAAQSYIESTNEREFLPADLPVDRLGLRDMTATNLKANGCVTLGALLSSTPGVLCKLEGFRPSMLDDIRQTLGDKHLHLMGDKDLTGKNVLRSIQARAN